MSSFWASPRLAGASSTMAAFTPCSSWDTEKVWMLSAYFRVSNSTETGLIPVIPLVETKGTWIT